MLCPKISFCPLFNIVQSRSEFSWVRNYCHHGFEKCSRLAMEKDLKKAPMDLLPNGEDLIINTISFDHR